MAFPALEGSAAVAAARFPSHGIRGAARERVACARGDLLCHLTRAVVARVKASAELIGERLERWPGGRARAL
jgi:hypothetical protein